MYKIGNQIQKYLQNDAASHQTVHASIWMSTLHTKHRKIHICSRRECKQRGEKIRRAKGMVGKSDHCDKHRRAACKPREAVSDSLHPQNLHGQIEKPCSQPGNLSHIENLRHFSHNDQIQDIVCRSHAETGICQSEDQQTPAFIPQSQKKSCNGAKS